MEREETTVYIETLLENALAKHSFSAPDRALLRELVFGVVRWQATLDWLINRKTDGRTQKKPLQILLRLALYQMFWLERIPDHAAVHETVQIAKELGFGPQSGFVNALLRGYARERDATKAALGQLRTEHPALGYSHPDWLWQRWNRSWEAEALIRLLAWNNTAPANYARPNTLRTNAEELASRFQQEGVRCARRHWPWLRQETMFELQEHPPLDELPSFRDGLFYVQDPSTLLAVLLLDPHPGESILDFCAAPGGKTTFMAQLMNNQGSIMAQDLDIHRRNLIQENCARLGVTCVLISRATTHVNADLSQPFDRILVDAPCSNTGVLRRRVDLRWRVSEAEIQRLAQLQLELLRRACAQLRPGGTAVYSTCSLEPEENRQVIDQFLEHHPEFTLEKEMQLLPFQDQVDGAYVARLRSGTPKNPPHPTRAFTSP